MALKWNRQNGNWLISASRDHFCKLFDIRNLKEEVQCFRGHKKEACSKLFFFVYYCLEIKVIICTFFTKRNKKNTNLSHQINVNKAEVNNRLRWSFIVLIFFYQNKSIVYIKQGLYSND